MHTHTTTPEELAAVRSSSSPRRCGKLVLYAVSWNSWTYCFLFPQASHSCRPNVATSTTATDGTLIFTAIEDIDSGEEILASYLIDLFTTPRSRASCIISIYTCVLMLHSVYIYTSLNSLAQRRERLRHTKNFICQCSRCCSFDDCRGFNCLASGCTGIILDEGQDMSPLWVCRGRCFQRLAEKTYMIVIRILNLEISFSIIHFTLILEILIWRVD